MCFYYSVGADFFCLEIHVLVRSNEYQVPSDWCFAGAKQLFVVRARESLRFLALWCFAAQNVFFYLSGSRSVAAYISTLSCRLQLAVFLGLR